MRDVVKVFALGGLDENGKNLYVVEINNDIFVLECGIKYPDRSTPGIDFIIPRVDYLKKNRHRVRAYIISHGHSDQLGALYYIYQEVPAPIYASSTTISAIKLFGFRIKKQVNFDFVEVKPSTTKNIAGRDITFFQTAHNIPQSFGVSIPTDQGSIVYATDFIVEYNTGVLYRHDLNALAKIAEKNILLLMTESLDADKPGYASPTHRLTPHVERLFLDSPGRIFIAMLSQNIYNIHEILSLCVERKKKILLYDKATEELLMSFPEIVQLLMSNKLLEPIDNILRIKEQDAVVLMLNNAHKIYQEIALIASQVNENKMIALKPSDTFVVACPPSFDTELIATDAVDELYRSGVKVINIDRKTFSSMHAREEDLKMMLCLLKPKFYMPIKGEFRQLIANAKIAVSVGVQLSHNNIFVLDNGMELEIENQKARIMPDLIDVGDVLIDGIGIGDVGSMVIADRQKLSDNGVIILGATVSKSAKSIIAGPDVQMRGFVFVKDAETVLKGVSKIFVEEINKALQEPHPNFKEVKQQLYELCVRYIRRETGKSPMILPLILEID